MHFEPGIWRWVVGSLFADFRVNRILWTIVTDWTCSEIVGDAFSSAIETLGALCALALMPLVLIVTLITSH